MKDNAAVITGAAVVTALGNTLAETWDALLGGQHGIRPIEGFDPEGFDCQMAAQVRGLDTASLEPRSARIMDLHSHMLLRCVSDAFTEARLDTRPVREEDIGLFVGMGMVDYNIDDFVPATRASVDEAGNFNIDRFYARGYQEIYPLITLCMLNNISACQAAIHLTLRGENAVFSPHAESGAQAIAEGVKTLLDGKAKAVLAGGVSEKISPLGLARAQLRGMLARAGRSDVAACRPFAAQRGGAVLGEGCGMVALESRQSADQRGIPYAAMITGSGNAFEAEEGGDRPTSRAIARAMSSALESAELLASDIDAVIAHGDGSPRGDGNEITAIHEVFTGCVDKLVVYSSKAALGHLLAGAPAVDLILGLRMLSDGVIPPTLHCRPLDGSVDFQMTDKRPMTVSAKRLLVNCRSSEGHCATLVVEARH